jgi:hypothetical protein
MSDKETKKQLINAYKERSRTQTGGVYLVRNRENGKVFVDLSADMAAAVNRFNFARQMNSCINVKLNNDWAQFGADAFDFEVAETIEKNEQQSPAEFRDDLELLKKMWIEKFDPEVLY